MPGKRCASHNQTTFNGEIDIHFPGRERLTKSIVWAFPRLSVCFDCGFTEFLVGEAELVRLRDDASSQTSGMARQSYAT